MLKTGINFHDQGYHTDHETTMRLIREAGFDCIFSGWTDDINVTDHICNLAAKYGVAYEAVHAPFGGISHIWEDNEQGAVWVDRLKHIADVCQRFGIGYMTIHVTECKQFNPRYFPSRVTAIGVQRYAEIIEYAAERGVKAAIENTEFPEVEMLPVIGELEARGLTGSFGTLYDAGHWHCYPTELDFADAFGKHLIGTHIHDNFGQKDPAVVSWSDDSHILPFDGTIDYRKVGDALRRSQYQGSIMLEVFRQRFHAMPWYEEYTFERFLQDAHDRAVHVAKLCE